MIIIRAKLKSLPESCIKCKFSKLNVLSNRWDYLFNDNIRLTERICRITGKKVPIKDGGEGKRWHYTKCKDCPLEEVDFGK